MSGESTLVNMERYLKNWSEPHEILILLSCYDFRVDDRRFNVSRQRISTVVSKLRNDLPRPFYRHVLDARAFSMVTILVRTRSKNLRTLLKTATKLWELEGYIPYHGFLRSYLLGPSADAFLEYSVPEELVETVLGELERFAVKHRGDVHVGYSVPVRNCTGSLSLDEDNLERLGKSSLEAAHNIEFKSRMLMFDLLIAAALDRDPLMNLRELANLVSVVKSRIDLARLGDDVAEGVKLRYKYVQKHYYMLSRAGVVGRVMIRPPIQATPMLVLADVSSYELLYALAAATLSSSKIMVFKDGLIAATLPLPFDVKTRLRVSELLSEAQVELQLPLSAGVTIPISYEYYDPLEGRWKTEPVEDVLRVLKKFGLIDRRRT